MNGRGLADFHISDLAFAEIRCFYLQMIQIANYHRNLIQLNDLSRHNIDRHNGSVIRRSQRAFIKCSLRDICRGLR